MIKKSFLKNDYEFIANYYTSYFQRCYNLYNLKFSYAYLLNIYPYQDLESNFNQYHNNSLFFKNCYYIFSSKLSTLELEIPPDKSIVK
jgi:hypothetical protein